MDNIIDDLNSNNNSEVQMNNDLRNSSNEDSWTKIGEKILTSARAELYVSMRYLYLALNSLGFVRYPKTFLVACDGENIYYNPLKLSEKYKQNPVLVNRAYLHMILHCMFRHLYVDTESSEQERKIELWNMSCDIAVEYLIDHMEYSSIRQLIPDIRENVYKKMEQEFKVISAENVFRFLLDQEDSFVSKLLDTFLVDDHSIWYQTRQKRKEKKNQSQHQNQQDENEDNEDQEDLQNNLQYQVGKDKWKDISKKVETDLSTYQNGIGSEKIYLSKQLSASNSEKMSYREFLRKFAVLRETMQVDMDSFDYGFYHFGMEMYGNIPLIEELEYKEEMRIEEFVIVLDTSGSCSGTLIQNFLEETYTILSERESFFQKMNLHIIQCDNEIQSDICIHSKEELELYKHNFEVKGFGGTDFRPAFEYVNQLIEKKQFTHLKGLLYFTDGYGIYPSKKPAYQTAFIFVETRGETKTVPPWAMKLEID